MLTSCITSHINDLPLFRTRRRRSPNGLVHRKSISTTFKKTKKIGCYIKYKYTLIAFLFVESNLKVGMKQILNFEIAFTYIRCNKFPCILYGWHYNKKDSRNIS